MAHTTLKDIFGRTVGAGNLVTNTIVGKKP